MWKFALVLAVVHGASCISPSIYWVLKTLKCSEHRVILAPHTNLVETPEALDQICNRQEEFFRCLDKMVSLVEPVSVSELSSKLASEKLVFNSLCSPDSSWRRRYLEFAPCINMQQTEFCRTPEFLHTDGMDQSSPCTHVEEKMENCIAASLSMKCGVKAGQLFQYLLELKGDDICQPVEMTYTDAHPSSDENHSTESVFGEIYDQLVKKTGYIPEQDSEETVVLHTRIGHVHEKSESVDQNISSSLEIEDSDPYTHFMEYDYYSENVEHAVSEDNYSVSEVSSTVSEDSSKRHHIPIYIMNICSRLQKLFRMYDVADDALLMSINQIFNVESTLNPQEMYETVRIFPDGRINYYSRRRDIKGLETINCYNFPDYFVCISMPRSEYPQCLNTTVFTGPRQGEFFPEEFDPEFGAQWYETKPIKMYKFEPWVNQSIRDASDQLSYKSTSITEDSEAHYIPIDSKELEDRVELLEDVDVATHIAPKDALSFNILKDSAAHEFKDKTKIQIFKVFTTTLPSSKIEIKNLLLENIPEALSNLYESKRVSLENIKIRLDNLGNIYIFWNNQQESIIDTITCGKVNECHPKGEGIWKCVIVPRPPIET